MKTVNLNGLKTITADFIPPKEPTILIINGALIIEDSSKKSLDQYKGAIVNGVIIHPSSFDTSNFHVNGTLISYPDDAILMFQSLELTNSFIKSSIPGATYCVQGVPSNLSDLGDLSSDKVANMLKRTGLRAIEELDLEALKSKNIHFNTRWVATSEENAEQLMQIVSGNIGTSIVPAGYKLMAGGRLDMISVRRFGKKIYVEGDLVINDEDLKALETVEQLYVTGDVYVAGNVADLFFEKCSKYGNITVFKGEWIDINGTDFIINTELLKDMDKGVTFNILKSNVEILSDVLPELISEKIHGIDLKESTLTISLSQQNAFRKKIHNTGSDIAIREYEMDIKPTPELKEKDYTETKINCAYYKL